jgi:DNA gyrase subunit A
MAEHLTSVGIEEEMRQSYMDYAMSVIVGRALPDVRDGLKPVQRRVLYAMLSEGLIPGRKHSKCAGVVGEVLKKFHPHGDSPVYEALVRLAQPWALRYPLIDGQGNFGSIDGDPPAAYRYTECRLTRVAERLLEDIEKDTVDFIPNFDESADEPVVLPSILPSLLLNGADGIAVGMATHIPPHNLVEVVNATLELISNPNATVADLMRHIPGPDFPTGGMIYGREQIRSAYTTGKGIIQVRAKVDIEHVKIGNREAQAIVVTEIPFQVNKSRLIEKIADLVNGREIEGISKLRDESDRTGMRIVMELKRDATPDVVVNQLYKHTPLQISFGIINLAIVGGQPQICSLSKLLSCFLDHRRDVVTRRTEYELRRAKERMHLLEGFRIALLNLDEVIALIRKAQNPQEASQQLQARFELTQTQAQAILDLRLQKLTSMERLAIEKEHAELAAEIARLEDLLSSSSKIDSIISAELQKAKEEFASPRRTQIIDGGIDIDYEDLIEDVEMVVSVSHQGYVKRHPLSTYRAQKRGGKGVTGAALKEEDFVQHLFVASALADLLVFTSLGRLYSMKVHQVPEAGRSARGRALVNILPFQPDEKVTAILPVKEYSEERCILMATKQGIIKKTTLMEFSKVRKSGIIACTLDEGDELVGVSVGYGKDEVILATATGMAIRFSEQDIRVVGRGARGVKGIALDDADIVVGMTLVAEEGSASAEGETRISANGSLITVCENGFGKRTALEEYRVQGRAGKGVIDIKTDDRNGLVVGMGAVQDDSEMMLITSSGKIIRIAASGVSVIGRNTKGVKLIDLDEGEKVVAINPFKEGED